MVVGASPFQEYIVNRALAGWLRCPHCLLDLEWSGPLALRCETGHAFDVNKRGYVNLVPPSDRMIGDSAAMLDAREAFLSAGHYSPIRAAVAAAVSEHAARILDAG